VERIKNQANKVSELVFSADTGATYKKTFTLTWDILRETGLLLWLVICLVFVGGEWFWKNSISLGRRARDWYNDFQAPSAEEPKSATAMGQSALTAISASTENLLYQAKKQLGIDAAPPAPKPTKPVSPPPGPTQTTTPTQPETTSQSPASTETKSAVAAAAEATQKTEAAPQADADLDDVED